MKNKKISVYAITKNESKNVLEWYNSMKEADEIVVLDTGSTDNTVELLKQCPKIIVYEQKITPWRFDVARNISLSYGSKDTNICVCTDLDERFEKGWRKLLEDNWQEDATRAKYLFNWNFDENGQPGTTFYLNKIHTRFNYLWHHPVHEVLITDKKENEILIPNLVLNHFADNEKPRSSYLPLLELSVKEDPEDDRNMHYLGREYMYYGFFAKAIATFHQHLILKRATWKPERCASMRYMAYSYAKQNYFEEAIMWYKNAINESPDLREPYFDLGHLYYKLNDYPLSYKYLKKALQIKDKSLIYINEEKAWNGYIYDILSISSYYTKHYKEALKYAKIALTYDKDSERLKENIKIFNKTYLENKQKEKV